MTIGCLDAFKDSVKNVFDLSCERDGCGKTIVKIILATLTIALIGFIFHAIIALCVSSPKEFSDGQVSIPELTKKEQADLGRLVAKREAEIRALMNRRK